MWVTRNKDVELRLWIVEKPIRTTDTWETNLHTFYTIESAAYDNLEWEDEPTEVIIVPKDMFISTIEYVKTARDGIKQMSEILKV